MKPINNLPLSISSIDFLIMDSNYEKFQRSLNTITILNYMKLGGNCRYNGVK